MATNDFDLYVDDCIALAKSLVVKSQQTIAANNRYLEAAGHGLSSNPLNWRYYKNLKGEYYLPEGYTPEMMGVSSPIGYDTVMWVKDLDADRVDGAYPDVIYSKANLATRPISKSEYGKRTHLYKALVDAYPLQEALIERIINPLPDATVELLVDQPDGTIAFWDTDLVEPQETPLIGEIQKRLNLMLTRWDNNAYAVTDKYFTAAKLGIIRHALVSFVINIRDRLSDTPYAHSFHIWSYLGNYYGLDKFKGSLDIKQALWLKRNIARIVAIGGTDGILDWLEEEFTRPYGLKLSKLDLRKDSSNLLSDHRVEPTVAKRDYLSSEVEEVNGQLATVEDTLLRLERAGLINGENLAADAKSVAVRINQFMDSSAPTGVIECTPMDNHDNLFVERTQQKIKLWTWLAMNDKFLFTFPLSIPGKGDIVVSAKEALAIFIWCAGIESEAPFTTIPTLKIKDVPQWPRDEAGEKLSNEAVEALLRDTIEDYNVTQALLDVLLRDMSSVELPDSPIVDLAAYSEYIERAIAFMEYHELVIVSSNSATLRSQLTSTLPLFYTDQESEDWLTVDTFSEFFTEIQMDLSDLTRPEAIQVVRNITQAIFGNLSVVDGLPSPYYEMMHILRLLSSYALTFIAGGDGGVTKRMDPPSFYPTHVDYQMDFDGYLETVNLDPDLRVLDVEHTFSPTVITAEVNDANVGYVVDMETYHLGEAWLRAPIDLMFDQGLWQGSAYGSDMDVQIQWSAALPMNQNVVGGRWGYSLYKIDVGAPFCLRVRRGGQDIDPSKDGDILDVGFFGEKADEAAMINFMNEYASPGNGWLAPVTWYDQTPASSALYDPLSPNAYVNYGKHLLFTGEPRIGRDGALIKTSVEMHGIEELMIAFPNGSGYYQNDPTQLAGLNTAKALFVYMRVGTLEPLADAAYTSSFMKITSSSGINWFNLRLANRTMTLATQRTVMPITTPAGKLTHVTSTGTPVPSLSAIAMMKDYRQNYTQVRTLSRIGGNDLVAADGTMSYAETLSNSDTGQLAAAPVYWGGGCTDEGVELLIGQLIVIRSAGAPAQYQQALPNYLTWRDSTINKQRFTRQKGAGYGTVVTNDIPNKNWVKPVLRRNWPFNISLVELNGGTSATFTRGSGKYRFGTTGLVLLPTSSVPDYFPPNGVRMDQATTNGLLYSYQLENAAWVKTSVDLPAHALGDTLGIIRHFTATADAASACISSSVTADSVRFIRQMVIVDGSKTHFTMTADNGTTGHSVTVRFNTATMTATLHSTTGSNSILVDPSACRVVSRSPGYSGLTVYMLEMDVKIIGSTSRVWIHPGQSNVGVLANGDSSYHLGTENSSRRSQPIVTSGSSVTTATDALSVTSTGLLENYTVYFEYTPTYDYVQNSYLTVTETIMSITTATNLGVAIYRKGSTLEITLNSGATVQTFTKTVSYVVGQVYRFAFAIDYSGSYVTSDFDLLASLSAPGGSVLGAPSVNFGPMTGAILSAKIFSYASGDLDTMQAATTI